MANYDDLNDINGAAAGGFFCPNCGQLNTSESKFCAYCGTKVPQQAAAPAFETEAEPEREQAFEAAPEPEREQAFEKMRESAREQAFENMREHARAQAFEKMRKTARAPKIKQQFTVETNDEPESVFANGLPEWDIVPPQVMVRRR